MVKAKAGGAKASKNFKYSTKAAGSKNASNVDYGKAGVKGKSGGVRVGNITISVQDARKVLTHFNAKMEVQGRIWLMRADQLTKELAKFSVKKTKEGKYTFHHRSQLRYSSPPMFLRGMTSATSGRKAASAAKKTKKEDDKMAIKLSKLKDNYSNTSTNRKLGRVGLPKSLGQVNKKIKKTKPPSASKAKAKLAKALKAKAAKAKKAKAAKAKKDKAKVKAKKDKEKKKKKKKIDKSKVKKKGTYTKDPHPPTGKTYADGTPKFKGLKRDGSMTATKNKKIKKKAPTATKLNAMI